jgi:hypothetical protein
MAGTIAKEGRMNHARTARTSILPRVNRKENASMRRVDWDEPDRPDPGLHAARRALERYGVLLDQGDLDRLSTLLAGLRFDPRRRPAGARALERDGRGVERWSVNMRPAGWPSLWATAGFDRRHRRIVTFYSRTLP